ncbi:flagellar assembly peptidoglycan hydrolase FlgJ [Sideroxydans lithotrophicus]|uniref:Peptidoglycan hydrolase FlgJ n=1 Tax=Sideroxydans lithotrophicus (strain ES-1) TaxID=580332 RepID=D5CMX7_SIDLE|nr:flagellar assembly peptidoglycan hydrolase FlgJ [Sideroxydans lithotrophicus]ADE10813.1 flagellar rod assembly protein/muramidase FlgJ [Sideroxydans lithotrophicus ES-1]
MTISGTDFGNLAIDSQSLDKLRLQAKQTPDKALKAAAQQFETVFLNMMLKSMREATPQDGEFDSEQTRMFTGMLDQQLAQSMASRGIGLADIMVEQLSRNQQKPVPSAEFRVAGAEHSVHSTQRSALSTAIPSAYKPDVQQAFVDRLKAPAEQVSRATGIPAHLILGQAALESGWGKREIKMADGSSSHNLFGIKAGKDWNGKVAAVTTTEYHNGVAKQQVERFRAYDSYAESFQDYARLLGDNSRYAGVVGQGDAKAFAQGLQQAGYATDPHYADKLAGVIGSIKVRA